MLMCTLCTVHAVCTIGKCTPIADCAQCHLAVCTGPRISDRQGPVTPRRIALGPAVAVHNLRRAMSYYDPRKLRLCSASRPGRRRRTGPGASPPPRPRARTLTDTGRGSRALGGRKTLKNPRRGRARWAREKRGKFPLGGSRVMRSRWALQKLQKLEPGGVARHARAVESTPRPGIGRCGLLPGNQPRCSSQPSRRRPSLGQSRSATWYGRCTSRLSS